MLSQHTTPVVAVARVVVSLSWVVFGLVVALRAVASRRAAAPGGALIPNRARAGLSRIGIALQGVAFALVWARSPRGGALLDHGPPVLGAALPALAGVGAAVGVAAVWLGVAAIRVLGREWSLTARLHSEHRLVTRGPYAFVRHPIYTAMLGLLVATGLALGRPVALLLALPLYAAGTAVRVRSEERLLRAGFGDAYERYARRVPAVVPGVAPGGRRA